MSSTPVLADLLRVVVLPSHLKEVPDADNGSTSCIELCEPKADMRIRVIDVPDSSTIVRIERLGHLGGIRHERNLNLKKICDYLLVIPDGQKSWAVLVEMKKTLANVERAKEQLRRSIPVVKYLQSVCKIHSEQPMQIVLRHAVLIEKGDKWIDKDRTRVTKGVELRKAVYKGIDIKTIVGTSVTVRQLVDS